MIVPSVLHLIFREDIVPEFWRNFDIPANLDCKTGFDKFERAVTQLYAGAASFASGIQELTR